MQQFYATVQPVTLYFQGVYGVLASDNLLRHSSINTWVHECVGRGDELKSKTYACPLVLK